jgi:hypothetical protein
MGMAQFPAASGQAWHGNRSDGNKRQITHVFSWRANEEETHTSVLPLQAVPTAIVVGGVGYYFLRAVHQAD